MADEPGPRPAPLRPSYPIRTERLLLRPLTAGDADALLAYRGRPDVSRYVPFEAMSRDDTGEWLRKAGAEYGVTTGRPRRCGWFDAVIARYATRVNGITGYFLTKLDLLSGLEQVPVCVAYEVDGKRYDEIPMTQTDFHHAVPVYEYFDGWWEDISKARSFDELPANARAYIGAVEEMIGAPVCAVGVGPRRDQTLQIRDLLRNG